MHTAVRGAARRVPGLGAVHVWAHCVGGGLHSEHVSTLLHCFRGHGLVWILGSWTRKYASVWSRYRWGGGQGQSACGAGRYEAIRATPTVAAVAVERRCTASKQSNRTGAQQNLLSGRIPTTNCLYAGHVEMIVMVTVREVIPALAQLGRSVS